MSVAAEREEILRLIGRLSASGPEALRALPAPEAPRLRSVEPVRVKKEPATRPVPVSPVPSAPVFCWDYLAKGKPVAPECMSCSVYRLGAYRCYEVAKMRRDGHMKLACATSCDECEYHRWVRAQPERSAPGAIELLRTEVLALCQRMDQRLAAVEGSVRPGLPAKEAGPAGQSTLSGKILPGLVPDVLQLISSNVMSGVFSITEDGSTVRVHYHDGEIVHAEGEGLEGESAFFAAMAMERGEFYFQESNEEATRRTVEGKAQFLILEALRQIDEKHGGEEGQQE